MENRQLEVDVVFNLERLLNQEDLDCDYKITVEDLGPKSFELEAIDGSLFLVQGTYPLSNLLQILSKAHSAQKNNLCINTQDLFINPVDLLRNRIRNEYWDTLTRTLDEKGLLRLLEDPKTQEKNNHRLYVPATDPLGYKTFNEIAGKHSFLNLEVLQLPTHFSKELFKKLDQKPGLLSLALDPKTKEGIPFVVPGGRFNEMYGWDSYFILLGLLEDKKISLAKGIIENFAYQIEHYYAILNANRTYYLSRSNPPFFSSMLRAFLPYTKDLEWIAQMLELALDEYQKVWCHKERVTETGLNRYYGGDLGRPIEVEKGHFDTVFSKYAQENHISIEKCEELYQTGELTNSQLDEYFIHDRSMRESGHDTTNRLVGISAHLNPVDLNCLLFKVESDLAFLIETYFKGSFKSKKDQIFLAADWRAKAKLRKERIFDKLWDPKQKLFYDYNFKTKQPHHYDSMTLAYPLFVELCDLNQAKDLINNIIRLFEAPGGLTCSSKESRGEVNLVHPQRQWDYPFGWAPHQVLFWKGAMHYDANDVVQRLIYKWLYMMTKEAMNYAGVIVEKYHVLKCSHKAYAEYGNVGSAFLVYPKEGFGWVNASYQIGWSLLSEKNRRALYALMSPTELFK